MKNSIKLTVIVVVVLAAGLFLPITVPYSVKAPGTILPSKEYVLAKDAAGRITATLLDRRTGTVQSYALNQFERQDAVVFRLHPPLTIGRQVNIGDTIATISSSETERQVRQLEGALETAMASLRVQETGEKETAIRAAEQRVAYALQQVEGQRRIIARLDSLLAGGYISQQEYDIEKNKEKLYELEASVAEAHLQTLRTGAKPEQIQFLRAQIQSIRNELSVLRERLERFTFLAPMAGVVIGSASPDTLVRIGTAGAFVVIMPLKLSDRQYCGEHQRVQISVRGLPEPLTGMVSLIGNALHTFRGEQVLLGTAEITNSTDRILPGMVADCTIVCGDVSIPEYLQRWLGSFTGR